MDSTTRGASGSSRMPASLLGPALNPLPNSLPAWYRTSTTWEDGRRPIEMDPTAAQAGQLAESQAGAQEGEDVIPPGQRHDVFRAAGALVCLGRWPHRVPI
jgi:hypothetical protein